MRLIGYVRVSTARQVEEGLGLEVQRQRIEEWAAREGHDLIEIHSDEGVSGTKGSDEREGLAAALLLIKDGGADGLLVYSLHRLARQLDVQEAALAHVWKAGGTVFAVDVGEVLRDDPSDPMRTALRQMIGVFSQLERGMIAARLAAGRRMKAERGGFAYGSPPFGYRSEGGTLVPVESEQAIIKRIQAMRERGAYFKDIAATLDAEGLRPRRSDRWHTSCIRRIVARLEDADSDIAKTAAPDIGASVAAGGMV